MLVIIVILKILEASTQFLQAELRASAWGLANKQQFSFSASK